MESKKTIKDLYVGEPLLNLKYLNVKLVKKTNLIPYQNSGKGIEEQCYKFNVLFMDEQGSYIESVCFDQTKYDSLEEKATYEIRKFNIRKPE